MPSTMRYIDHPKVRMCINKKWFSQWWYLPYNDFLNDHYNDFLNDHHNDFLNGQENLKSISQRSRMMVTTIYEPHKSSWEDGGRLAVDLIGNLQTWNANAI